MPSEAQEPDEQPQPVEKIQPGAPVAVVAAIAARKRTKLQAQAQQPDKTTN